MKRISLFAAILLILISGRSQSSLNSALAVNRSSSANSLPDSFIVQDSNLTYASHGVEYALVAGGSKGIGYAIAEALARRGYNLILIARHMDSLISARNKLEYEYHVHVEVLSYDLSLNDAATDIAKWCTDRNIPLKMLCNVAGFGGSRDYLTSVTRFTALYDQSECRICHGTYSYPASFAGEKCAVFYFERRQHGWLCTYPCERIYIPRQSRQSSSLVIHSVTS